MDKTFAIQNYASMRSCLEWFTEALDERVQYIVDTEGEGAMGVAEIDATLDSLNEAMYSLEQLAKASGQLKND